MGSNVWEKSGFNSIGWLDDLELWKISCVEPEVSGMPIDHTDDAADETTV